ncbi:uncharacterized protein LOC134352016 isoform X2 [Mobula hypostoma]|uniref:uncharacterized protein LOC134352016 isoform X2 n=1 Tax=Mobula hypostoma TaxID=723540 RepID=UPI002FC3278B
MKNQGCAEILVGFGKGCSTDTILTDQGKDITVLRNQPYRTNVAKKLECRIPLGARPMHKSTLILEGPEAAIDYTSSYNQCFTNQKIQPIIKHTGYPDEIKNLGMNIEGKGHSTTQKEAFCLKEFMPRSILNKVSMENRTKGAQGLAMKELTNPTGSSQNYSTSYSSTHDIRCMNPSSCANISEFQPKRHTHNIITGEELSNVHLTNYKRKSEEWLQQYSRRRLGCGKCQYQSPTEGQEKEGVKKQQLQKGVPLMAAARMQKWALFLGGHSYEIEFKRKC